MVVVVVVLTRWRQKPAGIDKKRNYVTVILCIVVTTGSLSDINKNHCLNKTD